VGETPWRFKSSHPHGRLWTVLRPICAQTRMTTYEKTGSLAAGGSQASSHHLPTAYLDTNLVSALARLHIHEDEVAALFALVDLMHEGRIALVTSSVTKEEIDRVPPEHRAPTKAPTPCLRRSRSSTNRGRSRESSRRSAQATRGSSIRR
jgi:hypothetical protein